jgi:hypothetical protein
LFLSILSSPQVHRKGPWLTRSCPSLPPSLAKAPSPRSPLDADAAALPASVDLGGGEGGVGREGGREGGREEGREGGRKEGES